MTISEERKKMTISFFLDMKSGIPFYRQIIDQVKTAIATGKMEPGYKLPTVRQLAVELSINPNTVSRAYTELELTGLVETQMGSGTFVGHRKVKQDDVERRRMLDQICQELLSRGSSYGFTLDDIMINLKQRKNR